MIRRDPVGNGQPDSVQMGMEILVPRDGMEVVEIVSPINLLTNSRSVLFRPVLRSTICVAIENACDQVIWKQ